MGFVVDHLGMCYPGNKEEMSYHLPWQHARNELPWQQGRNELPWQQGNNELPWQQGRNELPWQQGRNELPGNKEEMSYLAKYHGVVKKCTLNSLNLVHKVMPS